MIRVFNFFRPPKPEQFNADTLEEAQSELVQHLAAEEYHSAMIALYEKRIMRLTAPTGEK